MEKNVSIKILKLSHFDEELGLPFYATSGAAGADIRASLPGGKEDTLVIRPKERVLVPTGLCFEIPEGFEIQVRPRSGLSFKTHLLVVNSPGTIDSDYRGEVRILLGNMGDKDEIIHHGDRVAQLVLAPVWQANFLFASDLSETERGQGGFGHTGRN